MRFHAMVLALVVAVPAWAQAADPVEVRYEMFWGGFRAGEAKLLRAGADSELVARATGLAESLAAFTLEAESQNGQFRSHSRSKSMESTLAVDFHGTPRTIVDEIRRTDLKSKPQPPVPEALKAGTMDPLTAMVTASRHVLAGHPGERFTVPVYDGRNRYDATVAIVGPGSANAGNRRITGTRATIVFKPLAGFRKKSQELWDGATFTLLLDPNTQLPARIVSESFTIGTVISAVPPMQKIGG